MHFTTNLIEVRSLRYQFLLTIRTMRKMLAT